jgi:hypothetical protein
MTTDWLRLLVLVSGQRGPLALRWLGSGDQPPFFCPARDQMLGKLDEHQIGRSPGSTAPEPRLHAQVRQQLVAATCRPRHCQLLGLVESQLDQLDPNWADQQANRNHRDCGLITIAGDHAGLKTD